MKISSKSKARAKRRRQRKLRNSFSPRAEFLEDRRLMTTTIGEVGSINLNHNLQLVTLERDYANPIVIAQSLSRNGNDAAVARITEVINRDGQPDQFRVFVQETPDSPDFGAHREESVSYFVVEEGSWLLPNGARLEAGALTTSSTAPSFVDVEWNADFPEAPVVLSQTQTINDATYVKTRNRGVSASGFSVALEQHEAGDQHSVETIGYVAIERGSGDWSDFRYEADTFVGISQAERAVSFSRTFDQVPNFVAGISTYNGADSVDLRYAELTATGATLLVQEDVTQDEEVNHAFENIDYVAIDGSGVLHAAQPFADFDPGLVGEYYQLDFQANQLDQIDFDSSRPAHVRVDSQIDFPVTNEPFGGLQNPELLDTFAIRWTGYVRIDEPGVYRFFGGSNDGSRIFINDQLIANNDGIHGFRENPSESVPVTLDVGFHEIRMEYFEARFAAGARLAWLTPGATQSVPIPADVLAHSAAELTNRSNQTALSQVFPSLESAVGTVTTDDQFTLGISPLLSQFDQEYGLDVELPGTTFGIETGATIRSFAWGAELPLNDDTVYVFQHEQRGISASFGNVTVGLNDSQNYTLIIDPFDPFVLFESGPISFGASVQGLIPFIPVQRDDDFRVPDLGVTGHLYGRVEGLQPFQEVPAALSGDIVLGFHVENGSALIPDFDGDASRIFTEGISGDLGLSASFGFNGEAEATIPLSDTLPFELRVPLQAATIQFVTNGDGTALGISAGTVNPLGGTPLEEFFTGTQWQLDISASGTSPLNFLENVEVLATVEQAEEVMGFGSIFPVSRNWNCNRSGLDMTSNFLSIAMALPSTQRARSRWDLRA